MTMKHIEQGLCIGIIIGSSILLAFGARSETLNQFEYPRISKPAWKRPFTPKYPDRIVVHDGDTFCYNYRPERKERRCYRLYGVDAPELTIKCERDLAVKAGKFLTDYLKSGKIHIMASHNTDKYGRTLAKVKVDGQKTDAATALILADLGHEYFGGRRSAWCQ